MAYDIIVLNVKEQVPDGYHAIAITRPSILGNPYYLKREADRPKVIEDFRQYLWKEIKENTRVGQRIMELADCANDIALVCCCKPADCHGDVIKSAIEWIRKRR